MSRRRQLEISLKDVNVLVIDDEPDACNLLKLLLKSAGASVYLARSADEGMEQLKTKSVDVLICDIGMPDVDGYTLIRRVRALDDPQKSEVAAVALTPHESAVRLAFLSSSRLFFVRL